MIIEVTDYTFADVVLGSEIPVLVEFYTDSCAPCKALQPQLQEADDLFPGVLQVCKMDAEKNTMIVGRVGIYSVPTLVLFTDGEEVCRLSTRNLCDTLQDFL